MYDSCTDEIVNFHVNYIEALNLMRFILGHNRGQINNQKSPCALLRYVETLAMQSSVRHQKNIAYWTNLLWLKSDNPTKPIIVGRH